MTALVTVTGAGGYIGRHVVQRLQSLGHDVLAVTRSDDPWLTGTLGQDAVISSGAFDLDDAAWERIAASDAVLHLAWRDGFVLRSRAHGEDLSRHYDFLMRAADKGVPRLAVLGTMHEIGYWEGAVDSATPANPTTPYGIAKDALRRLVTSSLAESNTALAWLRCYYITGDDARSNSIFSKILAAEARGDATFPFTTGKNLYDFIDVGDLARQLVAAALDESVVGAIECCTGTPTSLADAVEGFIAREGLAIRLEYGAFPDRPFDSPGVWGDPDQINRVLTAATQSKKEA